MASMASSLGRSARHSTQHLQAHHRVSLTAFGRVVGGSRIIRRNNSTTTPSISNTKGNSNGNGNGKTANVPRFPCVEANQAREARLRQQVRTSDQGLSASSCSATSGNDPRSPSESGPEPPYARPNPTSYHTFISDKPLTLVYYPESQGGSPLEKYTIAYETWGKLNSDKSNAILLHTGLSASSHAASTEANPAPGWWEKFIGPGKALDTNTYFVICTNVLGGCYGSTGPSSLDPSSGQPYGTTFPVLSIFDMVRAQWGLLDSLGIEQLYASVGSSMGGMQSLATGWLRPGKVGKIVSISGTARSSPAAIAMRFAQRSVLMSDPNWNNGFYYDKTPPHTGMKLARQIATITYRSGPEWDQRFGRQFRALPESESNNGVRVPALCPDFLIETYLDHQGEQFCLKYDANSLLYISKAMDLFDMTESGLAELNLTPEEEAPPSKTAVKGASLHIRPPPAHLPDLAAGLAPLAHTPILILGVQSDILFPVEQQRETADALKIAGNSQVAYYELGGVWGHDTFLLDVPNVGGAIRGFLS